MNEYHVPYRVSGSQSFFARTEVKDILAYLKVMINPDDDIAFLRISNTPRRAIGPSILSKLSAYAKERNISLFSASFEIGLTQTLTGNSLERLRVFTRWLSITADNMWHMHAIDVIHSMVQNIDYQGWLHEVNSSTAIADRKMKNVNELLAWLQKIMSNANNPESKELTISEAINKIMLIDMLSRNEEKEKFDSVHLSTLHAAKGLEFPYVIIAGMEEELLPHKTSIADNQLEEERRLTYVGITRAKRTMTFILAKKRKHFNEWTDCQPSRFLDEIPQDIVQWEGLDAQTDPLQRQKQGKAHIATLKALLNNRTSKVKKISSEENF